MFQADPVRGYFSSYRKMPDSRAVHMTTCLWGYDGVFKESLNSSKAHKYLVQSQPSSYRIPCASYQVPTGEDDTVKEGFVMFLSFAFFGAMPLLG